MLRFSRTIRKKLIEKDKIRTYLFYAIGEILLVVIGIFCPVRDYISVEIKRAKTNHRAVRSKIPMISGYNI